MKYLINIKILSLVISFICTLSVSSWERGSAAMTWPLNKEIKSEADKRKKHCNVPHYIHTNRAAFLGTQAQSRILKSEKLFSLLFIRFPAVQPPLTRYRAETFGHERDGGCRGDPPLVPFPCTHRMALAVQLSQPCLDFFLWGLALSSGLSHLQESWPGDAFSGEMSPEAALRLRKLNSPWANKPVCWIQYWKR